MLDLSPLAHRRCAFGLELLAEFVKVLAGLLGHQPLLLASLGQLAELSLAELLLLLRGRQARLEGFNIGAGALELDASRPLQVLRFLPSLLEVRAIILQRCQRRAQLALLLVDLRLALGQGFPSPLQLFGTNFEGLGRLTLSLTFV